MTETIRPDDTAGDLLARLAEGGAGLLVATLDGIADGSLEAREQPADGVSFAPKVQVDDARIDWTSRQSRSTARSGPAPRSRAPGPPTTASGSRSARSRRSRPTSRPASSRSPGPPSWSATAAGAVRLGEVKPHGRRQMAAADWARGVQLAPGAAFR